MIVMRHNVGRKPSFPRPLPLLTVVSARMS
jgi:hypothetical protein